MRRGTFLSLLFALPFALFGSFYETTGAKAAYNRKKKV